VNEQLRFTVGSDGGGWWFWTAHDNLGRALAQSLPVYATKSAATRGAVEFIVAVRRIQPEVRIAP
jgi:hypothetical protein